LQGVDASGILAFVDALEAASGVEMHSMMLLRHGTVIAEGWWSPYSADRPQLLYSLSKSFASTALGLAIAEGLVDLDDTVLSHFPELNSDITDPRSRSILVRHVAAMASGHREDTFDLADANDPADLLRGFLLIPPDEAPGSIFAYNQPCTFAIAAIIQNAAGMSLTDFLRPRLFDPLGIGEVGWLADGRGRELGFSGFYAQTEAIAKLGELYLRGGRWAGQQLLSADWVAEATRSHVATAHQDLVDWRQGYGFHFWMSQHGYRGDGANGQFCLVLPEQDAVLAITGQSPDMQAVLSAAWEHLLPALAFRPSDAFAAAASSLALADIALKRRLEVASLAPAAGSPVIGDSRTYTAGGWNQCATLTEVTVHPSPAGVVVSLIDDGYPIRFILGIGQWVVTDVLAASGGTSDTGPLRIDLILLETPHRLQILCTGETFTALWVTEPLHSLPLAQMRMPH